MTAAKMGTLYGVGLGPGDPELITVRAYRALKESEVIAFPKKMKGAKSYALSIVEHYVDQQQKDMLGLVFPMTKDKELLDKQWNKTVADIWERLREGKQVAFVTEGDPMLYSTFIHLMRLMQELHPEAPVKVIPGISSANGTAARLGMPLADGDEKFAIIPATSNEQDMRKAIEENDCVVFIKVAKVLDMMITILRDLQLTEKAVVITKATSDEERIYDRVEELVGSELEYLTLMVVRKS
jgi:precorrin-2/cobalt-factor-2 C20-methyltransferase